MLYFIFAKSSIIFGLNQKFILKNFGFKTSFVEIIFSKNFKEVYFNLFVSYKVVFASVIILAKGFMSIP